MISLNTLARPDAVLDLGPAQVDIKRRLIKLNPDGRKQTKKYRPVVPISETLLPWLEQCDGTAIRALSRQAGCLDQEVIC